MNEFQRDFLKLIKCAFDGEMPEISKDFDFQKAYNVAKNHQIVPVIYYGALPLPYFEKLPVAKLFFDNTCLMIKRTEKQREENELIFSEFDKNGIEYMPVKGSVIKSIYPYPEMRMMGDSDILVKEEKIGEIDSLMRQTGFEFYAESEIEKCYKKDEIINIELHKKLFSEENKDLYSCFGDGWKNAKKAGEKNFMYEMSREDSFLYLFLHLTKHYRNGGVGIKHVLDLYVYKNHYNFDMDYVKEKAEFLKLGEFFNNIMKLTAVWFDGEEPTEKTDFITDFIFSGGVFGTVETHVMADSVKMRQTSGSSRNIKIKMFLRVLFPSYKNMCVLYPSVKKFPVLLPFMYFVRFFERIVFKRKTVKDKFDVFKKSKSMITDENVSSYENSLRYVGLSFEFDFEE